MVAMSSMGNCTGQSPSLPFRVRPGSRSCTNDTSVLVPPMSKDMQLATPVASAICSVAITPAAGPDSAVYTGCSTAVSAPMMPPLDFMIDSDAPLPNARSELCRFSM